LTIDNQAKERTMPRGDKSAYTDKQKRQAEHIEEGYEKRGLSKKESERRAWATVNERTGGGKKSGSGRKKKKAATSQKKRSAKGARKRTKRKTAKA
jgi:plasmid stabilization system protein ParE